MTTKNEPLHFNDIKVFTSGYSIQNEGVSCNNYENPESSKGDLFVAVDSDNKVKLKSNSRSAIDKANLSFKIAYLTGFGEETRIRIVTAVDPTKSLERI